jgi:glycosyltransferase involved in cell wall biosynthesis
MNAQSWPVVLIPVYRPGDRLLGVLDDLLTEDGPQPSDLLIVDDGTGPAADRVLSAAAERGCAVLRCPVNRGKGIALKTGLSRLSVTHPGRDVLTADADGQHRAADIRAVAARSGRGSVVLGARPLDRMPLRSRFGNVVTDQLFRAITGRAVTDTQTGLRAYPADLLAELGAIPGERFEYEMNVLVAVAVAGRPIEEVPIPATYLDGNAGSNFGRLSDSARVLGSLVRHVPLR